MTGKWDNYWILTLHHNPSLWKRLFGIDPIKSAALIYKKRCEVPLNQCFYHGDAVPGFGLLQNTSLSNVQITDKLIVVSHGARDRNGNRYIDNLNYNNFGDFLYNNGLRNVGLLAIKACNIGCGNYLNRLSVSCINQINIGWLIGYKHSVVTVSGGHETTGFIDSVLRIFGKKLSDNHRVNIVRGNTHLGLNLGRRYAYN